MKVSVVMPVYNGMPFLLAAVESILAQTYRDFEFLIVDDGSTDSSRAYLAGLADPRVRVILHGTNLGPVAARNRGVAEARGEWVAMMDQDDLAFPTRLEKQLAAARANRRVVVWGAFAYHVDVKGRVIGFSETGPTTEEQFHRQRAAGLIPQVLHPTALLRRAVVLRVGGYDARFDTCEELELFDRMAEQGPVLALATPLLGYRIHGRSLSAVRFLEQRRHVSYVSARRRAVLRGETPLSLEAFLAARDAEPALRRWRHRTHDLSRLYYRRAGQLYSEGCLGRACLALGLSVALDPVYALPRLWRQRLSPAARRRLRDTAPGAGG